MRSGDTLSEITLMFTGNLDYHKTAQENGIVNPDLIYPGDRITMLPARPVETLKQYLTAIYQQKADKAYRLLASDSREKIYFEDFKNALDVKTFFYLDSMRVCSDFFSDGHHILQIKLFLLQDPASWGFNLIREKYKWFVLLFDLNPTFPQDSGFVEWQCE